MQAITFSEITKKLGISANDMVHYHEQGNKGIIEIDLKRSGVVKEKDDLFSNIYSMSEDVGIEDWSQNHDYYLYGTAKRDEDSDDD